MVVETSYKCETCGKSYQTEEECAICEAFHCPAQEIVSQEFNPRFGLNGKYPRNIVLLMSNGKKVIYTVDAPVIGEGETITEETP